jgi:DNA (cytosine-5)-methyltransferase 1
MAYHHLKKEGNLKQYTNYLKGNTKRKEFYGSVPDDVIKSVINEEIGEETLQDIFSQIDSLLDNQAVDLIIGGPPCQAYSVIGRARSPNGMKGDKRNDLYVFYAEFLEKYEPKYFVFENVPGLLSATDEKGELYLDLMQTLFLEEYGYETEPRTLLASDYGVPQSRKRVFLVGKKDSTIDIYPEPDKCASSILVEDIFADLPALKSGGGNINSCNLNSEYHPWLHDVGIRNNTLPVTFHQARPNNEQDLEIYKIAVMLWEEQKIPLKYNQLRDELKTHKNKESFLNRFKVVEGDSPYSHTVVAHIAMDGHYYIHPDIKQNRSLTPREAARLQTFPDDYYFESRNGRPYRTSAYRQIGNAVPVLLAQKIAEKLKENWES